MSVYLSLIDMQRKETYLYAKLRLKSACPIAQSDQSLLSRHEKSLHLALDDMNRSILCLQTRES